jgi:hypothetical protein
VFVVFIGSTVGQADGGAVSLSIYDKELLVLMINQRGLYLLAETKWESLAVLSDWLVSRIHIKRVFVRSAPAEDLGSSLKKSRQMTNLASTSDVASSFLIGNESKTEEADQLDRTFDVELRETEKLQILLDVSIDRSVNIERSAFLQWRSRRVPRLNKLNCKLFAFQDNETLRIDVVLKVINMV